MDQTAKSSALTNRLSWHCRSAAHANHTWQHHCSCMHKAHTRPNLPFGRPSRALWPPTACALFCAVVRAGSAHLTTRARRAHFDLPRGGQTHILCIALRALRCAACTLSLVRSPRFRATERAPRAGRGTAARAARLAGWGRACGPTDVPFMGGHGCTRAAAVDRRGLVRERGPPPSRADFANHLLYSKTIYRFY